MTLVATSIKRIESFYDFSLKKAVSLFIFNLAALSALLIFSGENYKNDTYLISATGIELHYSNFICSYRFFGAFLYYLLSLTGYSPIPDCTLDTIFFIIAAAFIITYTCIVFYNYIEVKNIQNIFILDFAIIISIVNVWFCDILSFPECVFLTAVGLFLCFFAINLYASSFLTKSKKLSVTLRILSSITLVCATGVYQQFMVMFFVFTMSLCCIQIIKAKDQTIKSLFSPFVKLFTIILPSFLIYILLAISTQKALNIKSSERIVITVKDIVLKIIFFAENQHTYLKGRYFFKSEVMTLSFLFIFLLFIIVMLKLIFKEKKLKKALIVITAMMTTYFAIYIPGIVSTADGTRPLFPLYSMFFAVTFLMLVTISNKKIIIMSAIVLLCVFSFNLQKIIECEFNQKKTNSEDAAWAEYILNEIDEYEKANNCVISSIALCGDAKPNGNNYKYSYEESSLTISYSRESLLCLKSPNKFFKIETVPDEIYNTYFSDKNWEDFKPSEQIVFSDNTAYICCY